MADARETGAKARYGLNTDTRLKPGAPTVGRRRRNIDACVRGMLIYVVLLLLLVTLPVGRTLADDLPSTPTPAGFVSALPVPEVTVSAGKTATVKLQFSVREGYHINSNHPNSDLQIPTELTLDLPAAISLGKITYPKGSEFTLSFSQEKLNVYTGDFTVAAGVSAPRTTAPGNYHVDGVLRYQACNDHACYPPKKVPVGFDIKVLAATSRRSTHSFSQKAVRRKSKIAKIIYSNPQGLKP